MTGFYKDYADSSDTHQNSAEASADAAEVSANEAAASAAAALVSENNASTSESNASTSESNASTSESNASTSATSASADADDAEDSATEAAASALSASNSAATAQNLEITSASFDTTDGTLTLTKANSGTVTTDLDGRYADLTGATFTGDVDIEGNLNLRIDDYLILGDSLQDTVLLHSNQGFGLVSEGTELRLRAPTVKLMSSTDVFLLGEDDTNGNPKVSLNYNNSERLATTSGGIDVTGNSAVSGDATVGGELTVTGSAEAELFKGDLEGAVHFKGAVSSGATLTKGDVVYVSGHSGQKTEVDLADASDSSKMPAFGIVAADPVGVNVDVVTFGTLKSIDTSTYTDGDELYVDTTAGQLTATAPSGEGNLVQKIAKVVKAHNSGNIKVMGAGRTNATPNLNDGNIFIGDSNNLVTTASFATQVASAETSHADVVVDGDFTSAGIMTTDGSGGYSVDSSTYATETYVDTAVSNLVDSAPATLDTLNELASALGDDANFSTTVTTSIGTKWTEDATKISNWDTAYSWGDHSTEGYLTAETNDLSTTVTWANVPDANITESSVTQHLTATNVANAGALMDSEVTNLAQVKAFDSSDYATAAQGSSADTAYSWGDHDAVGYLTAHQDISGKANLSGATFTGNVSIGVPPSGTQSLTVAGAASLYGGASVTGDITVTGTVDGVDIATLNSNALVDGDFTSNGFMKRTGAGTYTVDTSSYVSSYGGTFNGNVTVAGTPPSGQGILTAHFLKGNTTTGGPTTPVLDLEKNVTGTNGSGRFIEFNTKSVVTGSIVTRGHLGLNQTASNYTAFPYFSHGDGNCGFALALSGSSSFNAIVPASTTGGVTSSNINLGHQYARWNGIYLKISPNVSSDREYKRDIEELSEAEKRVAVACKGLIRKYRMKDAYEEKGENARLHIGIIAQDLQDAFTAEGLDAHRYGMFCSDTWHQATVTTEDEDGNVTTSVEDFELVEHAPEGATNITAITRLSVRYEELLAFIISTT